MHLAYRNALDLPSETVAAGFAAATEAIAELEGDEHRGLLGAVTLYFVEPADPPRADIGLTCKGFTTEVPGRIYVVHPWGTADVRSVVRHEIYHLWYDTINGISGEDRGKHLGLSEEGARAFAPELDLVPAGFNAPLRRRYDVVPHPRDTLATVIIDGTSNVFKIAATGTLTPPAISSGPAESSAQVTLATGLTFVPAHLGYVNYGAGQARMLPYTIANWLGDGVGIDWYYMEVAVVNTDETRVTAEMKTRRAGGLSALPHRYYVLQEVAF